MGSKERERILQVVEIAAMKVYSEQGNKCLLSTYYTPLADSQINRARGHITLKDNLEDPAMPLREDEGLLSILPARGQRVASQRGPSSCHPLPNQQYSLRKSESINSPRAEVWTSCSSLFLGSKPCMSSSPWHSHTFVGHGPADVCPTLLLPHQGTLLTDHLEPLAKYPGSPSLRTVVSAAAPLPILTFCIPTFPLKSMYSRQRYRMDESCF